MDKNINRPSDDRYFRTNSFNIAAFLFAKGFELAGIDKTVNPKRAEFIFANSIELQTALDEFQFSKENDPAILIDPRTLFDAIKRLKTILYQNIL